jgi:hypothetical protein
MKPGFGTWLERRYKLNVVASRLANCRRVEEYYGDLDRLCGSHQITSLLSRLFYSTEDERHGRQNPSGIPIDGNLRNGLATLQSAVRLYIQFRDSETIPANSTQTTTPIADAPQRAGSPRYSRTISPQLIDTPTSKARPGVVNGDDLLLNTTTELGIDLPRLIAKCSIWANPALFHALRTRHAHAAWFPNCRRGKNGEPKKGMADGVRFDNNTLPNLAIKVAVFGSRDRCTALHVCHVWPETCYDVRYHTGIANLVLLPAPLAGLSDHHKAVAECLRYRSYELFGWYPEEAGALVEQRGYPPASDWAPLLPIPQSIRHKFGI